jgi:hypothetical protein
MKAQYENIVVSSLMLYIDHKLCRRGEAFTNYSSFFHETSQNYNNFFNYSAPFKQLVVDESLSGAEAIKGVYLNSGGWHFLTPGVSGLHSINHSQGIVHFTTHITGQQRISGDYAIKDFNIYLTNLSEQEILFETKYHTRPKVHETLTGLAPDTQTYPAIFVKSHGSRNEPWSFGGHDKTIIDARLIVLADSAFLLDASCSILRDCVKEIVPTISENLPFNAFGAYTGQSYNYTGLATGTGVFIESASVSKNVGAGYNDLNPDIHAAFVDFELIETRKPRQFQVGSQ